MNILIVDIEMQVSNEYNFRQRTMTYISKLASEQLRAGEQYKLQKEIIAINILNFSYLDRNAYHSVTKMRYRKYEHGHKDGKEDGKKKKS